MKCKKILSLSMAALLSLSTIGIAKADSFNRISGKNRYETSFKAQELVNSKTVVFCDGRNFADSLSAVNLVNSLGAKVYLVNSNEDMSDFIAKNGIEKVYIVGGTNSVSQDFENRIRDKVSVERLAGANRYSTNIKTLEKANYKDVILASGQKYQDALSATRLLKENNLGLMLVPKTVSDIPDGYNAPYYIGFATPSKNVTGIRIAGKDDTDTSKLVADKTAAKNWIIVSGNNFADAISAINLSSINDADILIAPETTDNEYNAVDKSGTITVVGGQNAISDSQVDFALNAQAKSDNATVSTENIGYETIVENTANKFEIRKENNKYYAYKDGAKVDYKSTSNGIYKVGNTAYMLGQDSSVLNGKFNVGNNTYYSDIKTGLARGWKTIGKNVNYFSPYNYKMYKGGVFTTGKNCFWFDNNGNIKTGRKSTGIHGKTINWAAPAKSDMKNPNFNSAEGKRLARNQAAANFALRYDPQRFKWFGTDLTKRSGVYCCGAAYSAFKSVGVHIPGPEDLNMYADGGYRMVRGQYVDAPKFGGHYLPINFSKNDLSAGDLLFSGSSKTPYNHVAIYIGKNRNIPYVVHANLVNGYNIDPASVINNSWHYYNLKAVRY